MSHELLNPLVIILIAAAVSAMHDNHCLFPVCQKELHHDLVCIYARAGVLNLPLHKFSKHDLVLIHKRFEYRLEQCLFTLK